MPFMYLLYTHIYKGIHILGIYNNIYYMYLCICRVKNEITKVEFRQKNFYDDLMTFVGKFNY